MNLKEELLLTFSTKPSLLSSRKIERFLTFITCFALTIVFFYFHIKTIGALEFIEVIGVWLGYGGYNSFLLKKDEKIKKDENTGTDI